MKFSSLAYTLMFMTLLIPMKTAFCASPTAGTQHPAFPNLTDAKKYFLRTQLIALLKKHPKADVMFGDNHCETAGYNFIFDPKTIAALSDLNFAVGYIEQSAGAQPAIDALGKLASHKGALPKEIQDKAQQLEREALKGAIEVRDCGANSAAINQDRARSYLTLFKSAPVEGQKIIAADAVKAEGTMLEKKWMEAQRRQAKGLASAADVQSAHRAFVLSRLDERTAVRMITENSAELNKDPSEPRARSWIMFGQAHLSSKHHTTMRANIPNLLTIAVELTGNDVKDSLEDVKRAGLNPVEPDCVMDFRILKLTCQDYVAR